MRNSLSLIVILVSVLLVTGCGDDFYRHSGKYDEEYFNKMITAIESRDKDSIRALFAEDVKEKSDDLDIGIQEILTLYQGRMVSCNKTASETEADTNGYKHKYSVYSITTDTNEEYCISYLYQAGGKKSEEGFRYIAMCREENADDLDVMVTYSKYEGAYAYCSDEAKKRINKKLEDSGFDFEEFAKEIKEIRGEK